MNETTQRKWSLRIQAISTIALIIGGIFALWRYYDTTAREFQKPLWDRQVKLYFEATRVAASLTTTEPGDEWDKLSNKFWQLYRGPMCLIEDQGVEAAMVNFGKALVDIQNIMESLKGTKISDLPSANNQNSIRIIAEKRKELQSLSLRLSWACRDSLNETMDAGLPALKYRKD